MTRKKKAKLWSASDDDQIDQMDGEGKEPRYKIDGQDKKPGMKGDSSKPNGYRRLSALIHF